MEYSNWIQLLAALAQGAGAIAAIYVAIVVKKYTHKRDVFEFLQAKWQETQQINLHRLANESDLRISEEILYGQDVDIELSRKMYNIFLILNQILHYYLLYDRSIISFEEFKGHAAPTARLICREIDLIEYVLNKRGYSQEFADAVLPIIRSATPIELYAQKVE